MLAERSTSAAIHPAIGGHAPLWVLTAAALVVAAVAGCASIPPGHAGVLVLPDGVAPEPLGEGAHVIGPRARIELYNLRAEEHEEDLTALSADGAALEARASLLTFHPAPGEIVPLAREVGPDVYRTIVRPLVRSTMRRVLANWRVDQLDSNGSVRAQTEIARISAERLRPFHIVLDMLNLRSLALLPASEAYRAIVATSAAEQGALQARQNLELARRRAEDIAHQARGIAAAHAVIAPTLSPAVLSDLNLRAGANLLTAPSTTVVVCTAPPCLLEVNP